MRTPRGALDALTDSVVRWLDRVAEDGLLRLFWWRLRSWFGHKMVARKLVAGERVIQEVTHSGILQVVPALLGLVGLVLGVFWLPNLSANLAWFGFAVVFGLLGYAFFKALNVARDRFVVTDSRVFRVWGVWTLQEAEMEIVRVLDVTVIRPWWLRPFASGHIVLENAAQLQGLRDIKYIPRPEELARAIHRRRRDMTGAGAEPTTSPRSPRRRADHPRSAGPISARRR
ncbi:MAG: PH domain-containing protein [Jiangellaceae bacterium]